MPLNLGGSVYCPMTKTVLTCPQCGSSDLYYENAMITGIVYHCKKCDYVGPLVLEQDVDDLVDQRQKKK